MRLSTFCGLRRDQEHEQMNIFIGIEKIQGIVHVWEYEKGKKPKYDFDSFF
jgi:hypothetical protein